MYDRDLVVIADAIYPHKEEKPATLCVCCEDDLGSSHAQLHLTSHDPGVQESLVQLRLAGHAPSEVIVVGVVPESCGLGRGISLSVLNTCLIAVDTIARLLVERSIDCRRRHASTQMYRTLLINYDYWKRLGDIGTEGIGVPAVAPTVREET